MPEAAAIFRALSDETRLRILNLLRQREICVCQIVDVLGLCQSKVSRHLSTLKHAGLVSSRRDGLWVFYSLTSPDNDLHARIIDWLSVAQSAIRNGTRDLEALRGLGGCVDSPDPPAASMPAACNGKRTADGSALDGKTRLQESGQG